MINNHYDYHFKQKTTLAFNLKCKYDEINLLRLPPILKHIKKETYD